MSNPFEEARARLQSKGDAGGNPFEAARARLEGKGGEKPPKNKTRWEKAVEYVTTPGKRPTSAKEFFTENLPRSAANTLYGVGKILHDQMTGGPGKIADEMMGRPRDVNQLVSGVGNFVKNTVAPFGLAGPEAFKDAWTTAPVQSALSVYPAAKGLKNVALNPRSAMASARNAFTAPSNKTTALGKKWNIPTTLSEDLTGRSSRTDVLLERAPGPLGNKGFRVKQYEAAHNAAKKAISKYIIDPKADDILGTNEEYVGSLYEGMKETASKIKNQNIHTSSTKRVTSELLDRYPDVFKKLQDRKLEGILNEIKSDTKGSTTSYLDASYRPNIKVSPKALTFDEMWTLRKGLGEKIGQAQKQLASGAMDKTEVGQLKALYAAVSDDMASWAKKSGNRQLWREFQRANAAHKRYVVKYNTLAQAYEKVTKDVGDQKLFSPARFANELDRIARDTESGGIQSRKSQAKMSLFSKQEKAEFSGLANILQVVKRSGQYLENPPTGNRWGGIATTLGAEGTAYHVGGIAGMIKTAGAAAATSLIVKYLTTTASGKRLAMAASKISPTSPKMNLILRHAMTGAALMQQRNEPEVIEDSLETTDPASTQ